MLVANTVDASQRYGEKQPSVLQLFAYQINSRLFKLQTDLLGKFNYSSGQQIISCGESEQQYASCKNLSFINSRIEAVSTRSTSQSP